MREGRLYDLGRVLDEQVPVFPGRHFRQTLVTTARPANAREGMPPTGVGDNNVNWITEIVSGTTQLGTHLDALCHLQVGDWATTAGPSQRSPSRGAPTAWGRKPSLRSSPTAGSSTSPRQRGHELNMGDS